MDTSKTNKNNKELLLLFFLWPMLSLFICIVKRNNLWSKNIFWLFCIYYGYTFLIPSEGSDAFGYAQNFIDFGKIDISTSNFFSSLYSNETNYVDILQPFISFLISRFTNDPRILFATFGMIFGYFYSRNLWFLFDKLNNRYSIIVGLYILVFALICPIWRINGFRFWTASQIFLFGVLPYLYEGNKKWISISALSIFVHFSFLFPFNVFNPILL